MPASTLIVPLAGPLTMRNLIAAGTAVVAGAERYRDRLALSGGRLARLGDVAGNIRDLTGQHYTVVRLVGLPDHIVGVGLAGEAVAAGWHIGHVHPLEGRVVGVAIKKALRDAHAQICRIGITAQARRPISASAVEVQLHWQSCDAVDVDETEADFGRDRYPLGACCVPQRVLRQPHQVKMRVTVGGLVAQRGPRELDPFVVVCHRALPGVVTGGIGGVGQLRVAHDVERSVAVVGDVAREPHQQHRARIPRDRLRAVNGKQTNRPGGTGSQTDAVRRNAAQVRQQVRMVDHMLAYGGRRARQRFLGAPVVGVADTHQIGAVTVGPSRLDRNPQWPRR